MMSPLAKLTVFDRCAVAVAAASACALLLELTWPHELEAPAPAEQMPAAIEQTTDNAVPVGPLSDYLAVSERPLFTHDRRPFVFAVEAVPAPVGPRVEFELTAVIITSDTRLALLRSNLTPTVRRVALNEAIDGWTLAAVSADSVLMRQGEAAITVPLRPDLGGARSGHASRIARADGAN
jgi:hypothetical protein